MHECDIGACHEPAIVHLIGESGRSWRSARACSGHAQYLADYCAKPVEEWRNDIVLVSRFDHDTRTWVPVPAAR